MRIQALEHNTDSSLTIKGHQQHFHAKYNNFSPKFAVVRLHVDLCHLSLLQLAPNSAQHH